MLLTSHIVVALSSLLLAGFNYLRPSLYKLRLTYGLTGLTLVSGTILVIKSGAHILQSCVAGLVYIGFTLTVSYAAKIKIDKA